MLKVYCDFDYTITRIDTVDHILDKFANKDWLKFEQLYENNLITAKECLEKQVSLLDITLEYLQKYIENNIQITDGFLAFVKKCKELNYEFIIVSDGLDLVIKTILKLYNINYIPYFSNKLITEGNNFKLTCPFSKPNCKANLGCCKCSIVGQYKKNGDKIMYIGDGSSDYCVSSNNIDFVFAKDKLLDYCKKFNIPHYSYKNFFDIAEKLDFLINFN